MTLSEYLKSEDIAASRFAALIGVPASTVLRVIKGEREPGLELMRKIAEATNNRVCPNDFLGGSPIQAVAAAE